MVQAASHHHPPRSPAVLAAEAQRVLEAAGEQWTPMRAAVFATITGFARPASAYDLAEALSRDQGRRVAANSIYRILDLFEAKNLVRRIESANAFLANTHPGCAHDCIFLVCDDCGGATHLDDDRLSDGVRERARAAGFTPVRPVIEVKGRCADCAG